MPHAAEPVAIGLGTALTLGALQGVTEFLPVSSSGHIAIGAMLFGIQDAPLSLSIVLHAGTLLATLVLFRNDVARLLTDFVKGLRRPKEWLASESGKISAGVIVASVPTAILGLLLKDSVESWQSVPWIVGACLLVSAVMVWTTRSGGGKAAVLGLGAALIVGIAQGIAVLPGISRSGTTIAVAMLLGMRGEAAFRFSFLLSLPAVLGAVVLELGEPGALASVDTSVWLGGLVATLVGVLSLVALKKVVTQGRFWAFALYLVPVGLLLIAWPLVAGAFSG
ncbi:MAG: undecaprenyl-diphosphate phosphatase [Deltaproteobacteria bacterium]|nr:undecaprenyl-diphosphate phosphatase [Deltaproteobacteria bacterium]